MARKRPRPARKPGHDWYLRQWLASLDMSQTTLAKETGWSKSTTSEIVNGVTSYYREILNEVADALHLQPYELLMHPDDAMALRQLRQQALRVVETSAPLAPTGTEGMAARP